jgi:putative restriction endonuclease
VAFGVFVHRSDSIYDDSPAERYQFPSQYLGRVKACVADWIVYYEPRKVPETRGYFAVARVQEVIPDPSAPNMHLAVIEAGSYLDFSNPVPFSGPAGVFETGVLNEKGGISGRAQSAVRPLSSADFSRIVTLGIGDSVPTPPRVGGANEGLGLAEPQTPFVHDQDRDRVPLLTSRIVRDRVFRSAVLQAYDATCAITGLKLINGGGRAEVEAAHIKPVEASGPDIIGNGLALSGTAHWMFDRGLIWIEDDLCILVSRHVNDADRVFRMINANGLINPPRRPADRPHPRFLRWHRENCFKS